MKNVYSEAIDKLKQDLFKLHPDAEKIYTLIDGLSTLANPPMTMSYQINYGKPNYIRLVFDKNSPATEQVLFALRYLNRIAKASEISAAIREFDPSFDKGLSTPFYKLKDTGVISIYNPTITPENPDGSNHQVYYGLKDWFDGENKVKEDYLTEDLQIMQ